MVYGSSLRDMQFDTLPVDLFGARNMQYGNDPGYVHFMPYTSFVPNDITTTINNGGTDISVVHRNPIQELTDSLGLTSATGLPTDFQFPTVNTGIGGLSLTTILVGIAGIVLIEKL